MSAQAPRSRRRQPTPADFEATTNSEARARARLRERTKAREAGIRRRLDERRQAAEPPPLHTVEQIRAIVELAEAEGAKFVELVVRRVSPPPRGGTIRLLGLRGPRSDPDRDPPRKMARRAWAAEWRVSDLRVWLRGPEARRLAAAE